MSIFYNDPNHTNIENYESSVLIVSFIQKQ